MEQTEKLTPENQGDVQQNQDSAKNSIDLNDSTIKQIEELVKTNINEVKNQIERFINLKFDGLLNTPKPEPKQAEAKPSKDIW